MEAIFHIKTTDANTALLINDLIEKGLAEELSMDELNPVSEAHLQLVMEEREVYVRGEGNNYSWEEVRKNTSNKFPSIS